MPPQIPPPPSNLTRYEVLEEIGKGKFSVVHKRRSRATGEEFAVKVIDKRKLQPQERELLRTLNRLNRLIINLVSYSWLEEVGFIGWLCWFILGGFIG